MKLFYFKFYLWLTLGIIFQAMVSASELPDQSTILIGRAILPAATFAKGPSAGTQLGKEPINGVNVPFINKQPVQGFSAVLANNDGSFLVMSDNGFGRLENSADYHLRVYTIRPDFKTQDGGSGKITIKKFFELKDPNHLIPFPITHELTPNRILTGADFDLESFQKAPDDTFWFGDEFGPFLLHTDAQGVLLDPPIPLPDFDNPTQELRSPQNPFNKESGVIRVMNAVFKHAQEHGNTKIPKFSPDHSWSSDLKSVQNAGYPVIPWTVNRKPRRLELMKLGVNGIISDRPDLLFETVHEFDADGDGKPGDFLTSEGLIDRNQFDAQGHRGGRDLRPENTLPAMEVALDHLMTTLETNIGITKEGIPVLKYEPFVDSAKCRRADGQPYSKNNELLIKNLTLAELQTTFICDKKPDRGGNQKNDYYLSPVTMGFMEAHGLISPYVIPTVQQLFDFVATYMDFYRNGAGAAHPEAVRRWKNAKKVHFNIETKTNWCLDQKEDCDPSRAVNYRQMTDTLAQLIQDQELTDRVDIQSFDFRTLIRIQEHFSSIQTVYLFSDFKVDNLSSTENKLMKLYWPYYRLVSQPQPIRVKNSGGFEGIAMTPDGKKLITLLEKPLVGDKKNILLMHEFDLASKRYTGIRYKYPLDVRGAAIGDFVLFAPDKGLVIERDNSQGNMKGFKMIYQVTLRGHDQKVEKVPLVNLLNIADPHGISEGKPGDIGIGTTFGFPFVTIESVIILGGNKIGLLNDNNYPFSVGRHVSSGQPDDNEFIVVKLNNSGEIGFPQH